MSKAVCGSCRAPIRWVKTAAEKPMPLDLEPAEDGNVVIVDGVARVVDPLFDAGAGQRFKSHFATCPNAAQHRRRR